VTGQAAAAFVGALLTVAVGTGAADAAKPWPETGSGLEFGTYLGGPDSDVALDVATDAAGNVYVAGENSDPEFPVTPGAYDTTWNGEDDAFVAKLSPDGAQLLYSTFLGGGGFENIFGLVVRPDGSVVIAGESSSADFPTTDGAFDRTPNGLLDTFVAHLSADGSELLTSTLLGGVGHDPPSGLAVASGGDVVVAGWTGSVDFPTTPGAFDTTFNGAGDAYVVRLSADGSTLRFGTFLGGSNIDRGNQIALDRRDRPVVVGRTHSSDFPVTPGAWDESANGLGDAFVTRLEVAGNQLRSSTFLGGTHVDRASGVVVDALGRAVVTGLTQSADFPTTAGALDRTLSGESDGFLVAVPPNGATLSFGTYLGGQSSDQGMELDLDPEGDVLVSGQTASTDFPVTPSAFDPDLNGGRDAFLAEVSPEGSAMLYATFLGGSSDEAGRDLTPVPGGAIVVGETYSFDLPTTPGCYDPTYNGQPDAYGIAVTVA
jgi:hypothetical protein